MKLLRYPSDNLHKRPGVQVCCFWKETTMHECKLLTDMAAMHNNRKHFQHLWWPVYVLFLIWWPIGLLIPLAVSVLMVWPERRNARLFCLGGPDTCSRLRDEHVIFKFSVKSTPSHNEIYTMAKCINSVQGRCSVFWLHSLHATHLNQVILLNEEHNSNLIFNNKKGKSVFNLWALSQMGCIQV
jgi:hypothetical protein